MSAKLDRTARWSFEREGTDGEGGGGGGGSVEGLQIGTRSIGDGSRIGSTCKEKQEFDQRKSRRIRNLKYIFHNHQFMLVLSAGLPIKIFN